MGTPQTLEEFVDRILAKDSRYNRLAYIVVAKAMRRAAREKQAEGSTQPTHISAQELLEEIRTYMTDLFGSQARPTLNSWGVHSCDDFGEIVFNMIEFGLLMKTEKDSRAEFKGGYDFKEAFPLPFYQERKVILICAALAVILIVALILGSKR